MHTLQGGEIDHVRPVSIMGKLERSWQRGREVRWAGSLRYGIDIAMVSRGNGGMDTTRSEDMSDKAWESLEPKMKSSEIREMETQ